MKNLTLSITKISLLSFFLALISCSAIAQKGSGEVIKKTFQVESFDGIKIGGAYEVLLRQGENQDITLVTDDNIMENIRVTVTDGVLKVKSKTDMNNPTELKIYITVKDLNSIAISGACEIVGKNTIVTKNISIKTSGASEVEMSIRCSGLKIASSGASELKLSGNTEVLEIETSGATTIKAEGLTSNQAFVESSGASTVKLDVSESLDAKASGASTILYRGNPKVISNESGASNIKKM